MSIINADEFAFDAFSRKAATKTQQPNKKKANSKTKARTKAKTKAKPRAVETIE